MVEICPQHGRNQLHSPLMTEKWCKTFFFCWCACRFGTSVENMFGLCGRSSKLVVWLMRKRSGGFAHGHEVLLLIFFWEYRVDLIIATIIRSIRKISLRLRIEISKFAQIGAHKNDFLRYVPIVALKIRTISTHKTGLRNNYEFKLLTNPLYMISIVN